MSLYIDIKYLMTISSRLEQFKKKSDFLYNCRCPLCGDSSSNKTKTRGYFYKARNGLFYKCHNCDVSRHFGTFLKEFDPLQYKQYIYERYAQGNEPKKTRHTEPPVPPAPKFGMSDRFKRLVPALDTLDADHVAVAYCVARQIPESKFNQLYYVKDVADLLVLFPQYKNRIPKNSARIAMPLYNSDNELMGVSLRAIENEELRYIILKVSTEDEDSPLIFGLGNLKTNKPIHVVEGAIDSLFLPNCIACNGTSFGKIEQLKLPKEQVTVVIDNQPRNIEVCRMYEKYIDLGYKVCIWPQTVLEKDLNDMAAAGLQTTKLVRSNTYEGLAAKMAFNNWKKCSTVKVNRRTR